MHIIINTLLVIIALAIYIKRPKMFFLYWISIYPFVLPIVYLFLNPFLTPIEETFEPVLITYPGVILFLMFFLAFPKLGCPKLWVIMLPLSFLILFVSLKNIIIGLDIHALYDNVRDIIWIVAPSFLLITNKKVRPNRNSFIHYIFLFVLIQSIFCLLNLCGIKIYGNSSVDWEENLICGTFMRYNHMANYLSIYYLILMYEYMEHKRIERKIFLIMAVVIGTIILLSGSRMTLLLFSFVSIFFVLIYKSWKYSIASLFAIASFVGIYIIGNDSFDGQKADGGTGFERNAIGIINLVNSDDISKGSTIDMSATVLYEYFKSPLTGNGKSYRKEYYYGKPDDTYHNEFIFKTDARLAFMFVEFGLFGIVLYTLLFISLFKSGHLYGEEHKKSFYWGLGIYFLLFSVTDPGFWEKVIFSIVFVYVFSTIKSDRNRISKRAIINSNPLINKNNDQ